MTYKGWYAIKHTQKNKQTNKDLGVIIKKGELHIPQTPKTEASLQDFRVIPRIHFLRGRTSLQGCSRRNLNPTDRTETKAYPSLQSNTNRWTGIC